jgi:hypothetical protein
VWDTLTQQDITHILCLPQPLPKKVKWIVVGGAMACVAVPLVVVASPIWLPVGGMVWVCRERAAIRADAAER